MKVADLERYFADLAKLLNAASGMKPAAELSKIAEALRPFGEHTVDEFGAFLVRAEEYSRTGIVPVAMGKSPSRSRGGTGPKASVVELEAEIKHLYATCALPGVTIESIEDIRPKLSPLKKGELDSIAQGIGLVGMSKKTKSDILEAIISRIRAVKQSAIRTSVIDRPGAKY